MTEEGDRDYLKNICLKYEDLYDYYYEDGTFTPNYIDFGKMTEGSNIILDFLNNNYTKKYIYKYLWYTNKYTFFYIILILIVIFFYLLQYFFFYKILFRERLQCFQLSFLQR